MIVRRSQWRPRFAGYPPRLLRSAFSISAASCSGASQAIFLNWSTGAPPQLAFKPSLTDYSSSLRSRAVACAATSLIFVSSSRTLCSLPIHSR
jgi:hypothetical protein